METHDANLIAVGGCGKAVRLALLNLGMRRCSLQLIDRQCRRPSGLRLDWYGVFVRWFTALWTAHRAGAEFLLDDLLLRVARLRDADAAAQSRDYCWRAQFVHCETERSDVVKAVVLGDLERIRRETLEHMEAERRLIAIIDTELGRAAQAA